jgi:ABC-type multidrug transport system ATPase subunit
MGASGAGKTSLLNLVSGQAQGGVISGEILVNGDPVKSKTMPSISGFVHQDDVILESMTVREVLTTSAHLKLPRCMFSSKFSHSDSQA